MGSAILPGLLTVAIGACQFADQRSTEAGPPDLDHARFAPVLLHGEVIHESDVLGLPSAIAVVGEHLLVIDIASDSVVHVLDAADGTYLRSFGRRGDGPGEFRGAWSIDSDPDLEGVAWIFDLSLQRLTPVDLILNEVAEGGHRPETIRLLADGTVLDPVWVDTTLVSLGFFSSGRIGHFDRGGMLLRTVGDLPASDPAIPAEVIQHAYQSTLAPNPMRDRLAVVTRHADRVEVLGLDGSLIARAEPLFGFLPRVNTRRTMGEEVLATGSDLRFGYIGLAASNDGIYALFSGRTRRGFPGAAHMGEYLHVFDWDAELVRVFKMAPAAVAIAVDASGKWLYGVVHHPSPAIVRYKPLEAWMR